MGPVLVDSSLISFVVHISESHDVKRHETKERERDIETSKTTLIRIYTSAIGSCHA